MASTPVRGDHTIIYDADCGMCRTLLALVLRADRDRRLTPLALGTPEAQHLLAELSPEQRTASWHLIDPDGRRTSAGAAAPPLLRLLPHGDRPAGLLAAHPVATERAYRWVADHRTTLGPLIPGAIKRRATQRIASLGVDAGDDVAHGVRDAQHRVEGKRGTHRRV